MTSAQPVPTALSAHTPAPRVSLYDQLGGDAGLQQLVQVFYDIVETEPAADELHRLHLRGNGVAHSRLEQFNFLCGFLGGPKLYAEKHGHANIKLMHAHVAITSHTKDIWLKSMAKAIDAIALDSTVKQQLMLSFTAVAERLVNQDSLLNQVI
jgi:hemoglobin